MHCNEKLGGCSTQRRRASCRRWRNRVSTASRTSATWHGIRPECFCGRQSILQQEEVHEHTQGHMTVPALPAAPFAVVQAQQLLAFLEAGLNGPARAGQARQLDRLHPEAAGVPLFRSSHIPGHRPACAPAHSRASDAGRRAWLAGPTDRGLPGRPAGRRLRGRAVWAADAARDELFAYIAEHLSDPCGVVVIDETGFPKKGVHSAGVTRQYSGTLSRIANC